MRRDTFLRVVKERVPALYSLVWQAYSGASHLFYGGDVLASMTGIQQGDPFGPALFSLGIDSIVRSIESELNIWYLDDASIADSADRVLVDLERAIVKLNDIGLEINSAKCELTFINNNNIPQLLERFEAVLPNVKLVPLENLEILGSPVSSIGAQNSVKQKHEALERMVERLKRIDPHQATVLLKNAFSLTKLI